MNTMRTIAESAAKTTLAEHNIEPAAETETAIAALAWELGGNGLDFETALATLVAHAIEEDRAARDLLTPAQHDTLKRINVINWQTVPHTLQNGTLTLNLIEDDIEVEEIQIEPDGHTTKNTLDGFGEGWSSYTLTTSGNGQHWSAIY